MNRFLLLSGVLVAAVLTGCESVRSDLRAGVKEKIEGPTYRLHYVSTDARATYDAARIALGKMGYRFERGGAAQGLIEALGGVHSGESLKNSRQLRLRIEITTFGEGSNVRALFTEVLEDDFSKGRGRATENSLRDTSLYEVLFRHIEEAAKK